MGLENRNDSKRRVAPPRGQIRDLYFLHQATEDFPIDILKSDQKYKYRHLQK